MPIHVSPKVRPRNLRVARFVLREKLGLKGPLIHILRHMLIWLHLNIAKTQTMLRGPRVRRRRQRNGCFKGLGKTRLG